MLFNVVLFADVRAIVEYIYSDECVVYFLIYWCCICFVYSDLYLLFCATFCAVFCVDKCGACDVLRLILFCFLCCIQKVIYKWLGVYVVLYWFWLLFYLFYTKSSWLLLALLCTSDHHPAPKLSTKHLHDPPEPPHIPTTIRDSQTTHHNLPHPHHNPPRPITTSTHLPSTCIVTQHQRKTHNASYTTLHDTYTPHTTTHDPT